MGGGDLINKLQNTLNELINRNDLSAETTELSNEILEKLKIIESCITCKDRKIEGKYIYELCEPKKYFAKLEKETQGKEHIIVKLNDKLSEVNSRLDKEILCE